MGVARCLAVLLLAPALIFNVDWTGHGSWHANAAAVTMIVASAIFIEAARHVRDWMLTPLFIVGALLLVYGNTKQAMRNLSLATEVATEARAATLATGSQAWSHRSQLGRRRDEQVKIAGETAVGALEAQLQLLQLSDHRAWNATSGCEDVTARASAQFCGRVAEVRAKIEAAKVRDRIDEELSKLPLPVAASDTAEVAADPYTTNVVALLKEIGFKPSERIVKAEEALTRAFLFEMVAALGPTAWLVIVNLGAGIGATVAAHVRRAPRPVPASGEKPEPAAAEIADDYDRCIADCFEDAPGAHMKAKDIRPIAQAWFETRQIKLDEKQLWMRLGAKFTRDANNNRPRYLGLKVRMKGPPRLSVVSGGS
jgi:hypothetical protein